MLKNSVIKIFDKSIIERDEADKATDKRFK